MMKLAYILLFAVSVACNADTTKVKPDMVGRPADVAVFMPKRLHQDSLGQAVRDTMQQSIKFLAQYEQRFDLTFYDSDNMTRGAEQSRNILAFKIDPQAEEGVELVEDPPFAEGQLYIVVTGATEDGLLHQFRQQAGRIMRIIEKWEFARAQNETKANPHTDIADELMKLMGVRITVPLAGSTLAEKKREFAWIKRDHRRANHGNTYWIQEGIFIYHYPYTDTSQFAPEALISKRDEILKQHVPGPVNNKPTFMRTTPDSLFHPHARITEQNGAYAVEITGAWGITAEDGAFYGMGGPFISLSVHDEKYNRIVTAEGYVHAPEFSVREYLRAIRTFLYSLEAGL